MIDKTRFTVVVLATCIAAPAFTQAPNVAVQRPASKGVVLVRIDPSVPDKGLNVVGPIKVSAARPWPVKVSVTVVNLLEEEVFLTVEGIELMNLEYELTQQSPDGKIEDLFGSGNTSLSWFPDNIGFLKRLHACDYIDGKARPCGCAVARFQATVGDDTDTLDLSTLVGSKGTITFPIKGYFRNNGKAFLEAPKVPIIVVE